MWLVYRRYDPIVVYSCFPYTTQSPTTKEQTEFKSVDDIWQEIERRVKECSNSKFTVGTDICADLSHFCDPNILRDQWAIEKITEYGYVTRYNIPIARSLDDADIERLECFDIIAEEIKAIEWQRRKT